MKYLKIAWRNLWRNKRRSLITIASIFFGVLLATTMNSLQDGTYANMIDMMVKLSSGYIQVQNPEYFENKSINNTFSPNDELMAQLQAQPKITTVAKRLESFALISSGPNTRGGAVVGFEPAKDSQTSNLQNWVSDGEFLQAGDKGVLVTYNIAKHLGLSVNDTITPQMNNIGVFMDISLAQYLFSADSLVTSVMVMVHDYTDVHSVKRSVQELAGEELNVYSWDELNPEIVQFIESDKAGGVIMIGILYIVIGFGIFGTIIMMVAERKREMAVMIAVGMQKYKLATILFFETLLIGLVGVVTGFAASVPLILVMVGNPIELPADLAEAYIQYGFEPYLFFGLAPEVFWQQVITVFVITMLISIYPIVKVGRMVVSRSLKA